MAQYELKPQSTGPCEKCPLKNTPQLSPDMTPSGEGSLRILIVGESMGCFLPGTVVFGRNDISFIEDTKILNRPLYDKTRPQKMFGYRVEKESVTKIKVRCFPEIWCTADHKIEIASRENSYQKSKLPKGLSSFAMTPARLIKKGNYVRVPKINHADIPQTISIKKYKEQTLKYKGNYFLPDSIELTDDLSFLFGMYMGDGSSYWANGTVSMHLSKGYKETFVDPTAQLFKRFFNLEPTIKRYQSKNNNKRISVNVYSRTLCLLFTDLFGKNCYEKRIPFPILQGPKSCMKRFLEGWFVTDGCKNPEGRTKTIFTVSKKGAWQAALLGLKLGTIIGIINEPARKKNEADGYNINITDSHIRKWGWNCSTNTAKISSPHYGEDENYFYLRITDTDQRTYTGRIFDIETLSHKYNIPFTVHNSLEAQEGTQFIGPTGQVLRSVLSSMDYDLDRDFWKTNSICCRPPKKPTQKMIACCKPKLFDFIKEKKPKMIIALGGCALQAVIGGYIKDIKITKFRGLSIPIIEHNLYLHSTFHPSFIAREDNDFVYSTFKGDLKDAISFSKVAPNKLEPLDLRKPVQLITNLLSFNTLMEKLEKEKPLTAFDYETSCLKPQGKNSRIWSMSIAFNGISYAFPVQYPKIQGVFPKSGAETMWGKDLPRVIKRIREYLRDPEIKKVAQNAPFESIWSHFIFKSPVGGLVACTMTNQHLLDPRKGVTGLKFQAFARWGVHGYDKEVEPYIRSKGSSCYNTNRLHEIPLHTLLLYNALDSYFTERLYYEQEEIFNFGNNKSLRVAQRLFHNTSKAFTNCQKTGIRIDIDHYKKQALGLTEGIVRLEKGIYKSKAVTEFEDRTGKKFKLGSDPDLRILLFDILCENPGKKTETGLQSVDKTVLDEMTSPIGRQIVKMREAKKLRDTYIAQYLREEKNGVVYPFFQTHTARSGRSGCRSPNVQNVPKRNEKAKKMIRRGIIPSPGNKLVEADFASIEVRMIGSETKDPVLLKYLWNPTSDMHYDQGKDLFILDNDTMSSALRYNAKSSFVFPEFYGSVAAACAKNLWFDSIDLKIGKKADGISLKKHLAQQGIRTLDAFKDHVKDVETDFWKKYKVVKKWQKDQGKFYLKKGYIETHFGFRRDGYLNWNVILNTRIQSTAAHLLWWCFVVIDNIRIKEKWKTKLNGQIHDSIFFDLHPDEEEHVMKTTYRVMTMETAKAFPWIIVPIDIEIEMSGVDGSWYDIKGVSKDYYKPLATKEERNEVRSLLKSRVLKVVK